MYGVSKITAEDNIMLISYGDAEPAFLLAALHCLAEAGIVVDMISQTAPLGNTIRFSFSASYTGFDKALKALHGLPGGHGAPAVSGGYSKINLFGEEMVHSVGVAARALQSLQQAAVDIALITTSDLDISLLVRQEDVDVAAEALNRVFEI